MRDYRSMGQIAEDEINAKSLRALTAANDSKDPSAVKRMYADVDNIRSRYDQPAFGTANNIEATPAMARDVAAQFPVDPSNDENISAFLTIL